MNIVREHSEESQDKLAMMPWGWHKEKRKKGEEREGILRRR